MLRRSVPMEELWRVARGEIKYQNYMKQAGHFLREAGAAGAAKQASILPSLPQELVRGRCTLPCACCCCRCNFQTRLLVFHCSFM